jgi:hypothetical protein
MEIVGLSENATQSAEVVSLLLTSAAVHVVASSFAADCSREAALQVSVASGVSLAVENVSETGLLPSLSYWYETG